MAIQPWEPFREMMSLRNAMDRLFEEGFMGPLAGAPSRVAIDMYQTDSDVVIKASLPGIKPEDVEITCAGETCTIRGETKAEREQKREDYLLQERRYGSFSRTISLPVSVRTEQAEATFENGVLTLRLPKAPEARPRRIQLKTGKP